MPRVLVLVDGADTGGGAIKIKHAFDRYAPGWEVRAVRRADNYIRYPADVEWPKRRALPEAVRALWEAADVVHMTNSESLAHLLPGYDDKPKVLQIRGRGNGARIRSAQARGVPVYVSTPNLLEPGTEWLPNIGDGDALRAVRQAEWHAPTRRHPRLPRLVHAPTIRRLKGTEEFLAAMERLRGIVDVDVIEGLTLEQCLRRKARGDYLFDQFGPLGGAYGSNAIEGWGLGMPVVNQEPSETMRAWYLGKMGYLPFEPATPATVADVIGRLATDAAYRDEVQERGDSAFYGYHEASQVVRRLIRIYNAAIDPDR